MLNKVKTKALISVGAVAATSFILMMGYTAGQHSTAKQSRKEIELAAAKLVEDKQAEDKASILSSDTVKEFLTQYYTKENDVNYEAAFQKRKQAPVTESNSSSKPKVTEVRTGKETDITTSYQQHLKRLIADNNSDIQSSQKKIEELHTLIDTKNKDNKKLQSIYDAISELH